MLVFNILHARGHFFAKFCFCSDTDGYKQKKFTFRLFIIQLSRTGFLRVVITLWRPRTESGVSSFTAVEVINGGTARIFLGFFGQQSKNGQKMSLGGRFSKRFLKSGDFSRKFSKTVTLTYEKATNYKSSAIYLFNNTELLDTES